MENPKFVIKRLGTSMEILCFNDEEELYLTVATAFVEQLDAIKLLVISANEWYTS